MMVLFLGTVDDRCGMELDETDPAVWLKLEAATKEYIDSNTVAFQAACDCVIPPLPEEDQWAEKLKSVGKLKSQDKGLALFYPCYYHI